MSMELDTRLLGVTGNPPENKLEEEKRVKSPPPPPPPIWESKRLEDLKMSDFSVYDNDPKPFIFFGLNFVYENKAYIQKKKEFQAASAAFQQRLAYNKHHNIRTEINIPVEFPILAPLGNAGGTTPRRINDDSRLRLTPLCNLALDKYNAENQGANFVLVDILKTAHNSAGNNYITFLAAPAAPPSPEQEQEEDPSNRNNNSAATTFQARVWKRGSCPPKVCSCAVVKTA